MTLTFAPRTDGPGLSITDPVERRQFSLRTRSPVDPTPVPTEPFHFPVDDAVAFTADELTVPTVVAAYVRDGSGEMVANVEHYADQDHPPDAYTIELCAPIKLYARVDGPISVRVDATEMRFSFDGATEILLGARSHHDSPASTITTTGDPADMMTAISYLGSALKTTSPERSYPTLRGHPPTIALGTELTVPDELERPRTGVRLELPPEYRYLYVAAPLAYYLGADVVPGSEPRLVTDSGFEHSLGSGRRFETEVERVLKQTFFLDCVVRTEGLYRIDLHERAAVESALTFEPADLYDRPLAERLSAYHEIPFTALESHIPEWKLTTHVTPTPDNVEILPFVVDDLAVVRTPVGRRISASEAETVAVEGFMRNGDFTRSTTETSSTDLSLVDPEDADSLEQAWVGDDAPLGASKATATAFRNRLDRSLTDGDIDIAVVCNDAKMAEEHAVASDVYGSREELPFDVTLHRELSTTELRRVLDADTDFLHYIGHIDDGGFRCVDGVLDVATLDAVGVDAFLLNACRSYEQGMALIDAGAVGGVVTLQEVIDSGAVRIGSTMTRLLNRGFPLRAALDIARDRSIVGGQYIVVGDGNADIAHAESGTPLLLEIEELDRGYEVTYCTYLSAERGMGSMVSPAMVDGSQFLNSGNLPTIQLSDRELKETLLMENMPIRINGDFTWSADIDVDDL